MTHEAKAGIVIKRLLLFCLVGYVVAKKSWEALSPVRARATWGRTVNLW